jgi:DNA-binding response OmpR family regulator
LKLERLLIVEDSKMSNNLIKNKLSKYFKKIDQAFSLSEAEKFLNENQYDLIILDLHLPDGEGIELVEAVHSFVDTRIVVLTSETDISLREELFKYGIIDYIIKDSNFAYSIEEIIKLLENLSEKEKSKILIIDDSKFICNRVKKILLPRGYEVDEAYNGMDGFKKAISNKYNLIILDIELPDVNGSEILKKLRSVKSLYHVPIIVLSGTATPRLVREILKNGANDYIQKPFVIEEFILKVDLWIDYFEKEKELLEKTKELEKLNKELERRVEEEVKKRRKQEEMLLLQSRYAQMGEIIAMIAHQWKQPLNVLSLSVGFLKLQCKDKKVEEVLKQLENSVFYMSKTIDDFRDFFSPQKEKAKTNWQKIFEKALDIMRPQMKNVKINVEIKKIEDFYSYENELMQVVINVLKNAYDVIREKKIEGEIDVEIEGKRISIEDNGGGIPEEIMDKIFDPYFSTKSKNGTGIGLYMSKIIVETHCNGKIWVENTQKGAKFIIDMREEG